MLGKIVAGSAVVASVILFLVLQTTTPSTIGPVGLLAVFFLLYVIFLGIFSMLGWVLQFSLIRLSRLVTVRKPLQPMKYKQLYYLSSVLALGPVMMLAMKSIGSLGFYETALVILFIAVAILYVSKRNF